MQNLKKHILYIDIFMPQNVVWHFFWLWCVSSYSINQSINSMHQMCWIFFSKLLLKDV